MRDSESRSSRHRRQGTRSTSRDRDRDRNRDRREKIVEREKDRERERGYRDRDYDRDYNSRQYRSKTPSTHSRHSHSKRSKAKKSKKHKRHSSSSDDNSHFSDCSDTSKGSRVSSASRSSRVSKKSSSRSLHTRTNSPDGNSSSLPATVSTAAAAKPDKIDLNDTKVRAALETIDEDAFVPKTFYSTRDREAPVKAPTSEKVIIDLSTETVSLPKPPAQKNMEIETTNEIFHPNFLGDLQQKNERWTKKLFNYRQKCFRE